MFRTKSEQCSGRASEDTQRGSGTSWELGQDLPVASNAPELPTPRITRTIGHTED